MSAKASIKRQGGNAMIEALVGMMLLSLVVAGSLMAMAKGAKATYSNNLRGQVIDQLRTKLAANGVALCGTTLQVTAAKSTLSASVTCIPYGAVTVIFPGVSTPVLVSVPPAQSQIMTATANSPMLGGALSVSSAQ